MSIRHALYASFIGHPPKIPKAPDLHTHANYLHDSQDAKVITPPRWEGPLDDYPSWRTFFNESIRCIHSRGLQHPSLGLGVGVEPMLRNLMMDIAPLEVWQKLPRLNWLKAVDNMQRKYQAAELP